MSIVLSKQQQAAIRDVVKWYKDPHAFPVYYLAGYAGTGKTTITPHIMEALGLDIDDPYDTLFGSYTGKASRVMRKRGLPATTIHRMIYKAIEDEKTGKVKFYLNRDSEITQTKLVTLDECSMVDDRMAQDLLTFGKKIFVTGDPGQIRPIKGEGFFTKRTPNFFLDEIHRQAADNPIIKLATLARTKQRIPLGDYGDGVRVIDSHSETFSFDDLLTTEQIITGKNDTRRMLNLEIKNALGFTDPYPTTKGIRLICLKNQHDLGLINGSVVWSIGDNCVFGRTKRSFTQSVVDDDQMLFEGLNISTGAFDDYTRQRTEKELTDERKDKELSMFDFAYAITAHKSQGSQWDEIILWDDGFGKWDSGIRSEWLYTSITRAAEKLTIVRT